MIVIGIMKNQEKKYTLNLNSFTHALVTIWWFDSANINHSDPV